MAVCNLGTLAADAQATVTIYVIPKVTGLLGNAAEVFAAETDPDLANNSRTETTTVEEAELVEADLAVTATATPGACRAAADLHAHRQKQRSRHGHGRAAHE